MQKDGLWNDGVFMLPQDFSRAASGHGGLEKAVNKQQQSISRMAIVMETDSC